MKNTFKLIGFIVLVAVTGFSFMACGGSDGSGSGITITVQATEGKLTISGLGAYNGKWVFVTDNFNTYFAAESANAANQTFKGAQITGGSATLDVWKVGNYALLNFDGDDTITLDVAIFNVQTVPMNNSPSGPQPIATGTVTVTFTGGISLSTAVSSTKGNIVGKWTKNDFPDIGTVYLTVKTDGTWLLSTNSDPYAAYGNWNESGISRFYELPPGPGWFTVSYAFSPDCNTMTLSGTDVPLFGGTSPWTRMP